MNPASRQSIPSSRDSNNTHRFKNGERITAALDILHDGRISLLEFITTILDPTQTAFAAYRDRFYTRPQNIETLMESIMLDRRGKSHINNWVGERAVDWVTSAIYNEMDLVKGELHQSIADITPEMLLNWSIDSFVRQASSKAPVLRRIIESAVQTNRAAAQNIHKDVTTVGL